MTEETETIDEIREWRRSRRSAGHNSESDLLALGRLVEKRWLEDEARAKRKRDMAEGTAAIQRLDYSKPPPGYLVHDLNDDGWWWRVDEPEDGCLSPHETEGEALAAAWAHHKAHNDPPGLVVFWESDDKHFAPDGDGEWHVYLGDPVDALIGAPSCWWKRCPAENRQVMEAEARAAAWAWHDCRLALAERLRSGATEKTDRRRLQIVAGLVECGRAGEQTPAMLALNRHVFGTHAMEGAGVDATADALLEAGFDPPADPRHFSAPLACNLLNVRAAPEHRPTGAGGPL